MWMVDVSDEYSECLLKICCTPPHPIAPTPLNPLLTLILTAYLGATFTTRL